MSRLNTPAHHLWGIRSVMTAATPPITTTNERLRMKTRIALAGLFIALLPIASLAAPAKTHPVKAAKSMAAKSAVMSMSGMKM